MTYLGLPDFRHDRPDLDAVLLVNLGTPASPTTSEVRRYLAEFLSDRRVIDLPRIVWLAILHGVILRVRPSRSAKAYQAIWTDAGSPLMVLSRRLRDALQARLNPDGRRPLAVELAMRYGEPSVAHVLQTLKDRNLKRVLVLPLYPQYSGTTTASVFDAVAAEFKRWRRVPELRFVSDYWHEPGYVESLASTIAARYRGGYLLFSFHGIPTRHFIGGDPYHCQCYGTARAVAERLNLAHGTWGVSFQSRVGTEQWLRPYTDETVQAMPGRGIKDLTIVCPGFAVDCLETLEEIAIEARDDFLAAGGERFDYIPALNDAEEHVAALASVVARHTGGWPSTDPGWNAEADAAMLRARARRHRELLAEKGE